MTIDTYKNSHPVGSEVSGTVLYVQAFGAFLELSEGITGILRVPEMAGMNKPANFPEDYPSSGERLSAYIICYDLDGKVSLTQIKEKTR